MGEEREFTSADAALAAQLEDVQHAVPTGLEVGVDTGAEAGERAAAVARLNGFTKSDWRALSRLAAEGKLPKVYEAELRSRSELQWPGIEAAIRDEYHSATYPPEHALAGKLVWTKQQMVLALFHGHQASAASIGRWEATPKRVLVERLVLADLAVMAVSTAVEDSTGKLWVPKPADVRRHGG